MWHQRIIRYQGGLRYHSHPVATDGGGLCTYFSPEYQPKRFIVPNLYIYHYGHAKSIKFHKMKQEFYNKELKSFNLEDGTDASVKFDEKLDEFINRKEPVGEVLEYDGVHPKVIRGHPLYNYVDEIYNDAKFEPYTTSIAYNGTKLPTIPQWMIYEKKMAPFYNVAVE